MSFLYIKKVQYYKDFVIGICAQFSKSFFFFFHKILLKVGDIAASMCNYNFAKFHQYLM